MGKYRKVDSKIWNDEKFMSLSDKGKLVFFFCLTHPNLTVLGAMRHSVAGMASEIGWMPEAFGEAFGEAFRKGMVKYDGKACFVWLPNFLRFNRPESPNVVKSWEFSLDLLPECALKIEMMSHVKDFMEGYGEAFRDALPKALRYALPKAMPNQEQEQEQEHINTLAPTATAKAKQESGRKATVERPKDEAFEFFADQFAEQRGMPYRSNAGDFVQLAGLRKTLKVLNRGAPPGWHAAVGHYLSSVLGKYTLADLCSRYDVFLVGRLDRYGKPAPDGKPAEPPAGESTEERAPVCDEAGSPPALVCENFEKQIWRPRRPGETITFLEWEKEPDG